MSDAQPSPGAASPPGAKPAEDARFNVAAFHAGVMGVGDFRTGEFNEQVVPQNELPAGMDVKSESSGPQDDTIDR